MVDRPQPLKLPSRREAITIVAILVGVLSLGTGVMIVVDYFFFS